MCVDSKNVRMSTVLHLLSSYSQYDPNEHWYTLEERTCGTVELDHPFLKPLNHHDSKLIFKL